MLRTMVLLAFLALSCASTGSGSRSYDVDVGRATELGYAPAGGSESERVAALAATVAEALRTRGLASGVRVDDEGRLQAVLAEGTEANREGVDRYCQRLGRVFFRIVATDEDLDLATERAKLEAWRSMNLRAEMTAFNRLPPEARGADPRIVWFLPEPVGLQAPAPVPCLRPRSPAQDFGAHDFVEMQPTSDGLGYPAIGFALAEERRPAFKAFTGEYAQRQMAIVVDGRIVSAPRIDEPLPGRGIIRGSFESRDEVERLIAAIEDEEPVFLSR